ncbi:signal peptidase S26 family [Nitrosospira multiformis]|uniref:Signal peptidase S26 family n=1 Tax=Nitrosospira multiformis TaxID=1231 RepID=A0A2T5I6D6_9PROT|nr:S26 family signal peptidase [Nitrosospira multiformis]PTQ79396.1 signal peptidase S26 family [Nitrosospira multiformis]
MPREADNAGRVLPRYTFSDYTLKESELLLMSDVSWSSFDGRYFGPVDVGQVRGVIKPLIVFQDFFGILDKKRDEELSVSQASS